MLYVHISTQHTGTRSLRDRKYITCLYKGKVKVTLFENRVLRKVFGPKRDKVTGEWRKLHNEELNDL